MEFDTIAAKLDRVLALATDWHRIYRDAPPTIRRQLNQAVFTALYLRDDPDNPVTAQTAEPFTPCSTSPTHPPDRSPHRRTAAPPHRREPRTLPHPRAAICA